MKMDERWAQVGGVVTYLPGTRFLLNHLTENFSSSLISRWYSSRQWSDGARGWLTARRTLKKYRENGLSWSFVGWWRHRFWRHPRAVMPRSSWGVSILFRAPFGWLNETDAGIWSSYSGLLQLRIVRTATECEWSETVNSNTVKDGYKN